MNRTIRIGLLSSLLAFAIAPGGSAQAWRHGGFPVCDAGNIGETFTDFHDNGNGTWYYYHYQCTAGGWMATGADYCYFTFPPGGGNYVCIPL
jgi:hypothetical protein